MPSDPQNDLASHSSSEDASTTAPLQPPNNLLTAQFERRAVNILERVADAFVALDSQWRILYANREACRINHKPLEEFQGQVHWEEWPGAVGTELERQFRRVMTEKVEAHFEHRYVSDPYDVWLEIDAYPADDGINLLYRDISERKRHEESMAAAYRREALLNQIGQAILQTAGTRDLQDRAVSALGEALGVDRCYIHFFDAAQDATWIETDWHREGLPSVAGRYPLSQVQPALLDDLFRHGASIRIADVQQSFLKPETTSLLEQGGYRALLTTPFYSEGKLTAVLALAMTAAPRQWTDDEAALVEAVAALTRSAVEAAHLLAEQQARLQAEALVGRIGAAIRSTYRFRGDSGNGSGASGGGAGGGPVLLRHL